MSNGNKTTAYTFFGLNIFAIIVFSALAGASSANSIASTIFAGLAFFVLLLDMLYAVISNRYFITRILICLGGIALNFVFSVVSGLSIFLNSLNIIGLVILLLTYLANAIFALLAIFITPKAKKVDENKEKIFGFAFLSLGVLGIMAVFLTGVIFVAFHTQGNTNAVNIVPLLITLSVAFACFAILGLKHLTKKSIFGLLVLVICVASILPHVIIESSVYGDISLTNTAFEQAFGKIENKQGINSPYNFALQFTGIPTTNYTLQKDKIYYQGVEQGNNITLRYDAYYPNSKSKGVLINLHGSGGDKDTGNYAHRNKYFASIGYTVFDIQFGDWNEKNVGKIPMYEDDLQWVTSHLKHLDEFVVFASQNEKSANWQNTFLTGVSMGGTQISRYALSFENSLAKLDVKLKGIIPIYPGYSPKDEGMLNCLSNVKPDSVPCLVVMGDYDCVVRPDGAKEYKEAYTSAKNPNCASVVISYAGHGSDYLMGGRSNQFLTYYMQNFIAKMCD